MNHVAHRVAAMAVLIALSGALAGCGGNMFSSLDPSDILDFLDTKKKLPGERKPVFPQGVPGIEQGVPRDLYKGANVQQEEPAPVVELPPEPKGKKAAKSKSSVNARSAARAAPAAAPSPAPAPVPEAAALPDPDEGGPDAEEGVAVAPPAPPPPKIKRSRSTSLPKEPAQPAPPAAPPQQEANSPFPNPTRAGTFSR